MKRVKHKKGNKESAEETIVVKEKAKGRKNMNDVWKVSLWLNQPGRHILIAGVKRMKWLPKRQVSEYVISMASTSMFTTLRKKK